MKKIFLFVILVFIALQARENPFVPTLNENDTSYPQTTPSLDIFKSFNFMLPSTARVLKSVTITYQELDGSINEKKISIDKSIDWHYPLLITQQNALVTDLTKREYLIPPFRFEIDNKLLYIQTNLELIRNFILPKPFTIVLDFKRTSAIIDDSQSIRKKYFLGIIAQTFDDFYRVNIILDGNYNYKLRNTKDGHVIALQ